MVGAAVETEPRWRIRAGLHFGPVVAGVVGSGHCLYDLWGGTVNTAARFARHAHPGCVAMTTATWTRIGHRCRGRARGPVEIEGEGEVEQVECLEAP